MSEPRYNTYIGARYIPLFCGDWDNTLEYEPLSIVSYEGNSYTSRTFVPTGVAITNTDYWFVSGNYNQQVESYRSEVANYVLQMNDLISNVGDINELETDDKTNIVNSINSIMDTLFVNFASANYDSIQKTLILTNQLLNNYVNISYDEYNKTLTINVVPNNLIEFTFNNETLSIITE